MLENPYPRLDGLDTVTGRATYTVDVSCRLVRAKLFRSPVPHAKIRRLDVSQARALTGVAAVLTAGDAPRKRFGLRVGTKKTFARDKARYVGDVIAAVAAVDEEIAEQAIGLIEIDTRPSRRSRVTAALSENARLVHEELSSYRLNSALARDWHPVPGTNIAHQTAIPKGDIDFGFAEADEILTTPFARNGAALFSGATCGGGRVERRSSHGVDQHTKGFSGARRLG